MAISTAVGSTRRSRTVGIKTKKGSFSDDTSYLTQKIAIFAEANTDNQATLDTTAFDFLTAKAVAEVCGYGSVAHQIARILRPSSGDPLGGITTTMFPIASDESATAAEVELGVVISDSITTNTTHYIRVNGRTSLDGTSYGYSVTTDDDADSIVTKIADAVSAVIGAPCTCEADTTNDYAVFTAKWGGATSTLNIEVETNDEDAGITYSIVTSTDGTGTVDLSDALDAFGETWYTLIVNPFGSAQFTTLEDFIGVPDEDSPTGLYSPTNYRPCMAYFGSVLSDTDDVVAITDASARQDQVANVFCPAPNSSGMVWEAAANVVRLQAIRAQNYPHLNIAGQTYPDMPVPEDLDIGDFKTYSNRDTMLKAGASTVSLSSGKYMVQDLVNTYHPDGENPPLYAEVRDLNIDWNVNYNLIEVNKNRILDNAIMDDDTVTNVDNVIRPKTIKQILSSTIESLASLALIVEPDFSTENMQVGINDDNPARIDEYIPYYRSSAVKITSTDTAVGFYYGS